MGPAGAAEGIERGRGRRDADEGQEESGQRIQRELEAAERHQALDPHGPRGTQQAGHADAGTGHAGQGGHAVEQDRHQGATLPVRRPMAASNPASSARGEGGQPAMIASTGTTAPTPPTTA